MKLSQCTHGVLVTDQQENVGMVVGITQNPAHEAVPLVKWQWSAEAIPQHHEFLELYEE